jgi:hypothetical protein
VEDTNITDIDLTATGPTLIKQEGCHVEWIRFKPAVASSAGAMYLWYRAEGIDA